MCGVALRILTFITAAAFVKEAAAGLLSGIFVMAVRNVLLFRGAVNILDFKVLFCVDGKLLCKAFSLCRQPLLHFFRLVQIAAKALSFAVVLAVEVVQDHCLTAAEFFDFFSQCGDLQQGYRVK